MMMCVVLIWIVTIAQLQDAPGAQTKIVVSLTQAIAMITNMNYRLTISSNMVEPALILLDYAKEKITETLYNLS